MNEELKNKANEALLGMIEDVQSIRDFTIEQAPDVVAQLLTWTLAWNSFVAILFVVIFGLWCWLAAKFYSYQKASEIQRRKNNGWEGVPDMEPEKFVLLFLSVIFFFSCAVPAFMSARTALFVMIAPKVWLIEYASKLIG